MARVLGQSIDALIEGQDQNRPAVHVDPAAVASLAKVTARSLPAGPAGLQTFLSLDGVMRDENRQIWILKPVDELPSDLSGAHSESFVLADGVPVPRIHSMGHSCLFSEAGKRIRGSCTDLSFQPRRPQ